MQQASGGLYHKTGLPDKPGLCQLVRLIVSASQTVGRDPPRWAVEVLQGGLSEAKSKYLNN